MTQYSGVYTLQQQGQALTSGQWATDPYCKNTTLLLHADGVAGGAQNNTFLDSSTNAFAITRNGNTTQGSFTPYGPDWSNYFDGTGDYLSLATATAIGSGNNTIEFWFYPTGSSASTYYCLYDSRSTTGTDTGYGIFQYNSTIEVYGNGLKVASAASAFSANTWVHVALVRTSGSCQLYINGVASGSAGTYSSNLTSTKRKIGDSENNLYPYAGYVSNLRETTGALYSGTFSPSTVPLTTTVSTGTVALLTCQSNRFADNSTNGYAIVPNGNTSVQRFSPFPPQYQYTPAVIGGSGYFDGSGDYLTVPNNTALQILGGSFTLDCWIYLTAAQANMGIIGIHDNSSVGYFIRLDTTIIRFWTSAATVDRTYSFAQNTWYHIAVVSSGTTGTLYVNGVAQGATFSTNGTQDTSDQFIVGKTSVGTNYFTGYISDVRVIKGSAVTPSTGGPTSPLTAVTNTTLLCNFTNAGIYDNAMMNNLETVGNAQVSTSVVKYGSGSLYFDGSSDWLAFKTTPQWSLGTGDFTVEMWVNLSSSTTNYVLIGNGGYNSSASNVAGWSIMFNTGGTYFGFNSGGNSYYFISSNASLIAATFPVGQWVHVAMVRQNGILTCYINGKVLGTPVSATEDCSTSSYTPKIGTDVSTSSGYYMNGYMDEVRITKGVARYTAPFTPQKVAFANQ